MDTNNSIPPNQMEDTFFGDDDFFRYLNYKFLDGQEEAQQPQESMSYNMPLLSVHLADGLHELQPHDTILPKEMPTHHPVENTTLWSGNFSQAQPAYTQAIENPIIDPARMPISQHILPIYMGQGTRGCTSEPSTSPFDPPASAYQSGGYTGTSPINSNLQQGANRNGQAVVASTPPPNLVQHRASFGEYIDPSALIGTAGKLDCRSVTEIQQQQQQQQQCREAVINQPSVWAGASQTSMSDIGSNTTRQPATITVSIYKRVTHFSKPSNYNGNPDAGITSKETHPSGLEPLKYEQYHLIRAQYFSTKTKGSPFETFFDEDSFIKIPCANKINYGKFRGKVDAEGCAKWHICCTIRKEETIGIHKATCCIPGCDWFKEAVVKSKKDSTKWAKLYKDHTAQHLRRFLYDVDNYKYSLGGFVTKAALVRHRKCGEHPPLPGTRGEDPSVEMEEEHLCPVEGCRQTRDIEGRGFSRYDNLVAHLRSIHEKDIPKRRGNLPKRLRMKRDVDEMISKQAGNGQNADDADEPAAKISRLE